MPGAGVVCGGSNVSPSLCQNTGTGDYSAGTDNNGETGTSDNNDRCTSTNDYSETCTGNDANTSQTAA